MTVTVPTLRPYQVEVARAILRAVIDREVPSISVLIARQGGKNEVSAQVETMLLARHLDRSRQAVKCAPTFKNQAILSRTRLKERLADAGLGPWVKTEGEHIVRLGRARQVFLSAERSSNVVGHTADLLLEVDEAQDVGQDKFDKEFRPMTASTAAPVVYYGTPWEEGNLLERVRQAHLEAERRDGRRRHFEFDWQVVAEHHPIYRRHVSEVIADMGDQHPNFLTQYCLKTIPGAGRLLGPTQLSLLQGSHAWLDAPLPGDVYVAGLDVAGEAGEGSAAGRHDSTVLTLARLLPPPAGAPFGHPQLEVVRQYAWTGEPHASLHGALASLLGRTWRVARVAVDATGIGEPLAAYLASALGQGRVEAHKLSARSKSSLGFDLLAAVNSGRLRLPAAGVPEAAECWAQLRACRANYRPNQTLNFYVDPRDGHDDYVISLALTVAAAKDAGPRRARGRIDDDFTSGGC